MIRIRPITEADIDAVAVIRVRTWQKAYAGIVPAEHLATMDPAISAEQRRARVVRPDQHTLVAEAGSTGMRLWVVEENHGARRFHERMDLEPDGVTQYYTPRGSAAQLPELRYATPL